MATLDDEIIDINKVKSSMSTELRIVLKNAGLSHFFKPLVEHNIHKVVDVKAMTDAQLMEKIGLKKGHGKGWGLSYFCLLCYLRGILLLHLSHRTSHLLLAFNIPFHGPSSYLHTAYSSLHFSHFSHQVAASYRPS
jgi:hypothetical protein